MNRIIAIFAGMLIAMACAAQTPAPITLAPGQTIVLQGKQGVQGVPGPTGSSGAAGKNGQPGIQGPAGGQGSVGPAGLPGAQGPAGASASCSVGTITNGVQVSVTQPTPGQCVFSFDFSGYTQSTTTTPPVVTAPPATCPVGTVAVGGSCLPVSAPVTTPTANQTWYVRPDGGNRYSANILSGQCDGLGDAAYPGTGVNQHCAFNDVRLLTQDGSYTVSFADAPTSNGKPETAFPARGWVGNGGDTYIIRGSIASGAKPYRIGWNWQQNCAGATQYPDAPVRGWCGNAFAGMPSPPAGTASNPTRILGENYANCNAQSARTPLLPGWGIGAALALNNSYLDVECLDITDSSQLNGSYTGDDSATNGLVISNTADHLNLKNIRMHGLRTFGMSGAPGDGTVMDHVAWIGNGGGGFNADAGDGTTGIGSLLVTNFEISWNGCAELVGPSTYAFPYTDCHDQNSSGYGDGLGTATVVTNGWHATFDTGLVTYNTQDGLDALHFVSTNGTSSFTVNNVVAYGNMGQQIKSGGDKGTITNSTIVGNCDAMAQAIPGTVPGYNTSLSDFCRASNVAVLLSTNNGSTAVLKNNRIYGYGTILVQLNCQTDCSQPTALVDSENNLFNGATRSDGNGLTAAYYFNEAGDLFANPGSVNNGNTFLSVKPGTFAYEDTNSITTGTAVPIPAYGPVQ